MVAGVKNFFCPEIMMIITSINILFQLCKSKFLLQGFRLLDVKINGICHCIFYLIESSTCPECNGSKVIDNYYTLYTI